MIARIVRDNLLAIAAAYRKATGKSLTRISKEFYGDAYFFEKLRDKEPTISVTRLESMIEQFRSQWPAKAPWPYVRAIHMGRHPQDQK